MLELRHGLRFEDLYDRHGLARIDAAFLDTLGRADSGLARRLDAGRADADGLDAKDEAQLLLDLGPHVEDFLAGLFGIEAEARALAARHHALDPLFEVRRNFVQRRALKGAARGKALETDGGALAAKLEAAIGGPLDDLVLARHVQAWEADEEANAGNLADAMAYAAWAALSPAGRAKHGGGVLFKEPRKIDPLNLIAGLRATTLGECPVIEMAPPRLRQRSGFSLSDPGMDLKGALGEVNYCIWCHNQGRDSCSKGLREKAPKGSSEIMPFRANDFGVRLAGCPLEERISEFQKLKADGLALAAVATIVIDNPMAPATGHRICNDCMKACVYQKQEPVNIPEAETRAIKDMLELPWGFEIYALLTRWNPLNLRRPLPSPASGRRVLIAGMGPAGFTLAHNLLNDGHTVVGIDGLKIEPLEAGISGVSNAGERVPFRPIRDIHELYEDLDGRVMAGFGGVAEYGITVRWDKNFLKVVRLLLERRARFQLFGGVRFGGTITLDDAWGELAFDHVALALGAGRPTVLDLPNSLARGVRTASDFLMALQLTGAASMESLASNQMRLPVVVIGGGLTAFDTATEALAYYPRQVEKFLARYEALAEDHGEAAVRRGWWADDGEIADEFIGHARAIRQERARAAAEGGEADITGLLKSWGGVTVAYRRRLIDSPAYTLNHEEVEMAFEEGITAAECVTPVRVEVDADGAVCGVRLRRRALDADGNWVDGGDLTLAARSLFVAAGTQPNTVLAREDSQNFQTHGKYFQACDEAGKPVTPELGQVKPEQVQIFLARHDDGRMVSFLGDLHPSYQGNVVKAMASAKQGFPVISRLLAARPPVSDQAMGAFFAHLNHELRAVVERIEPLTPDIVEIVVRAPRAARHFRPGQFFRLQNFEAGAVHALGTDLAMEGLALTGAQVDREKGLVSLIVVEMGGSSNLCGLLKPGEPVVLMGPTGTATEIPSGETVLLAGGGLGNAVLLSIAQALRAAGNRVLYFAGYRQTNQRYKAEVIEAAADAIVWSCEQAPGFAPARPQDISFVGNIVQSMEAYGDGRLGPQPIAMADIDRIIAIGSQGMMAAVAAARHQSLKPHLPKAHIAIGSINAPMQCMMKEVCAQCLHLHIDPQTGEKSYVFACFNQDQPLDCVNWQNLGDRLRQNAVTEKLTAQWIDRCLAAVNLDQGQ